MTVKDLFYCMNTDCPSITIYCDFDIVYSKPVNTPIGHLKYWERNIAWIEKADSKEIRIRIERE